MLRLRTAIAATAVAAFALILVRPAGADCDPTTDPSCRLTPLQSRQVNPAPAYSSGVSVDQAEGGALTPAGLGQMPLVAAGSVAGDQPPAVSSQASDSAVSGPPSAVSSSPSIVDSPSSSAPSFPSLDLRLRYQVPGDISCGVQALGMALDGLDGQAPTSAALLDFLIGQGMLYDFGTGVEELAYAAASFGYAQARPVHDWTLDDLRAELAAGRPVVAALGAPEAGHFVTVTGLSADGQWIAYNDPTRGKVTTSVVDFEALWSAQGNSGVAFGAGAAGIGEPISLPALALLAGAMALVSTSTLARKRQGIGGAIKVEDGSVETAQPPYPAPAGLRWTVKLVPVTELQEFQDGFKTISVQEQVYGPVQVQVGTRTVLVEQQAYRTITVDEGHWKSVTVTKHRNETYVDGYRNQTKKVPVPGGWKYTTIRVPIYKSRRVAYPAKDREWVPNMVQKQVPAGKYLAEVEEPIYETRQQVIGYKTVEVEVPNRVEREVTVGMEVLWELVGTPLPAAWQGTYLTELPAGIIIDPDERYAEFAIRRDACLDRDSPVNCMWELTHWVYAAYGTDLQELAANRIDNPMGGISRELEELAPNTLFNWIDNPVQTVFLAELKMDLNHFWNYEPVFFSRLRNTYPEIYLDAELQFRSEEETQKQWQNFIAQLEATLVNYPPHAE